MNSTTSARAIQTSVLIGGFFLAPLLGSIAIRYFHLPLILPVLISCWFVYAIWFMFTVGRRT